MDIPEEIKELPKLEAGQMTEYFQFLELHRIFFIDEVRKWINLLVREEISMSKFVENFHVKLFNHKALSLASKEIEELKEKIQQKNQSINELEKSVNHNCDIADSRQERHFKVVNNPEIHEWLCKVEEDQQELWDDLVKYLNHYNSQNQSGQMFFPVLDLKSKYHLIKK